MHRMLHLCGVRRSEERRQAFRDKLEILQRMLWIDTDASMQYLQGEEEHAGIQEAQLRVCEEARSESPL